jgi:DinB superfamily
MVENQSRRIVLFELIEDNSRRIHRLLADIDESCLHWSVDGEANSIATTIWHATRIFDVFLTQHISGEDASDEIWHASGFADETNYNPIGVGTYGWGAITGYSVEEVAKIPKMDPDLLLRYYEEVMEKVSSYLNTVSSEELDHASIGFDGKQTNYYWIRHPLFDLTRHVGEILALKAIWDRAH